MNTLVYALCCRSKHANTIETIYLCLNLYLYFPLLGSFRLLSKNYTLTKIIQIFTLTNTAFNFSSYHIFRQHIIE